MTFQFNDGGMVAAGYKKPKKDCVIRAIAIATQTPYLEVRDLINQIAGNDVDARNKGVDKKVTKALMAHLGWTWTPTMMVGSGCKVHLVADELPLGCLVVSVSKHLTVMIDGVIHDVYDDVARGGKRAVYGYWKKN
jgi:hypothetical protein